MSQERTEYPTAKRRRKARDEGQVARSAELVGSGILLGLLCALPSMMSGMSRGAVDYWVRTITVAGQKSISSTSLDHLTGACFLQVGQLAGPLMGLVAAVALVSNVMQVGVHFSTHRLQPRLSRFNVLQGLRGLFAPQSLIELVKALAKVVIVCSSGWYYFDAHRDTLLSISMTDPAQIAPRVGELAYRMALRMVATLAVLSALDYAYQRWQFERSLRMTKQEVKDEMKDSEGNPEIKARIRQRQREIARRRMMADVPNASVVITNPSHFAVALQYELGQKGAPKVLAKGQDLIAQRIRDIATAHHIPMVENPPLARSLYRTAEIGMEIPPELYRAVAEVLALVWRASQVSSLQAPGERKEA